MVSVNRTYSSFGSLWDIHTSVLWIEFVANDIRGCIVVVASFFRSVLLRSVYPVSLKLLLLTSSNHYRYILVQTPFGHASSRPVFILSGCLPSLLARFTYRAKQGSEKSFPFVLCGSHVLRICGQVVYGIEWSSWF